MNKEETNSIYEEALMDICKKHKLPEMFEKLPGAKFNKILINNTYTVMGIDGGSENVLKFDVKKAANFPGDDLVSQRLVIREWDRENKWIENFTYGTIILTHHDDIGRWTGTLHLLDEEKEINRVEQISEVYIFPDV